MEAPKQPGSMGWDEFRDHMEALAEFGNEYAGIPMPIEGQNLVVEPSYRFAEILQTKSAAPDPDQVQPDQIRSTFWSTRKKSTVVILNTETGRVTHDDWGYLLPTKKLDMELATAMCSCAWTIEQEATALELLMSITPPHTFRSYFTTGMFVETSRRSGITYIFRRLKPTVALSTRGERTVALAALCMHPIAHYEGTWAGAMCPTDDVIAHLQLMRGDEHMFWKRCNQHPATRPEAGI